MTKCLSAAGTADDDGVETSDRDLREANKNLVADHDAIFQNGVMNILYRCNLIHACRLHSTMATFPSSSFSIDRFRCVKVDINKLKNSDSSFSPEKLEVDLRESEKSWFKEGIRAIWFNVPTPYADFVPTLVKNDFRYHHAKPDYVSLVKWISADEPNNIPTYPYTNVGVGGLILDSKDRVLVVQEKYKVMQKRIWKYPGGFSAQGEDISETAEREVFEETGIKAKFESIVAFRHLHRFQFGGSDVYIICSLAVENEEDPKSLELTKCAHEIHDVAWMPIDQVKEQLSEFNRYVLEKYLESRRSGFSIKCEDVNFILGGKASVYSVHNNKRE